MPSIRIKSSYRPKITYKELEKRLARKIDFANQLVSNRFIFDSRPLVPLDTGQLRNSGKSIRIDYLRYFVIWSAYSEEGYDYAEVQYYEVFNHVDGRYAARWVDRLLQAAPGFYNELLNTEVITALR